MDRATSAFFVFGCYGVSDVWCLWTLNFTNTAINSGIGHMISSVPASKTMDVYNAFAKFNLGSDVGPYMMSKVNAEDAQAAYKALMDFKDVVKASQR